MVVFSDGRRSESLLREALASRQVTAVAIHAHSKNSEILELVEVSPESTCVLAGEDLNLKFKTSDLVFVSFQIDYATYNFETMVSRIAPDGTRLVCLYPRFMFYSEKRVTRRINPRKASPSRSACPRRSRGRSAGASRISAPRASASWPTANPPSSCQELPSSR